MILTIFGIFIQVFVIIDSSVSTTPPIVETNSGKVSGVFRKSFSGNDYMAYLGIPYAESPTENLRFKPPVPKKPWTNVKDGSKEGQACLQVRCQINY